MDLIRTNRDVRVDFFRGCALWWIFVDHIPGNVVADYTLHNFALCDAAEMFVFLAGYGAALAYGRAMDRHGWLYGAADALRRAGVLYVAHIFLFVVFSAQVSYSATALERSNYLDEIHLDVMADAPYRALFEALTLRYQPSFLNILPMYVVALAMFAAAMPLLHRPRLLAALSLALYLAARIFGWNLPAWNADGWYFNPLTWQLLFTMGAILAYTPMKLPARAYILDILAWVVVAAGLIITSLWRRPDVLAALPNGIGRVLLSVDKTGLHPLRLISILALVWLAARLIPEHAAWLRSHGAAPLVLIGQHSLPVFCAGIFLSFLGRLAMEASDGAPMQVAVNLIGLAALIAVGTLSAWYREKGRAVSHRPDMRAVPRSDPG
ncbi:MAG: OpgC domain-containing protein [Acetobacteraceae bacterium]|nr:OpgC domain-containing protein [Acetobacteraceae bacterium]